MSVLGESLICPKSDPGTTKGNVRLTVEIDFGQIQPSQKVNTFVCCGIKSVWWILG